MAEPTQRDVASVLSVDTLFDEIYDAIRRKTASLIWDDIAEIQRTSTGTDDFARRVIDLMELSRG